MSGRFGIRRLLAAAVLTTLIPTSADAGWHSDFSAAQAEAVRVDRPLLVHFFAEWCGPCKKMDREVLYAPEVVAGLARRVVAVKLDVDQHRAVAEKYRVQSVPTDLFLTPDGRVLGVMNGYRAKDDYFRRVVAVEGQYARLRELYFARSDGKVPLHGATDAGPRFPVLKDPEAEVEPAPAAVPTVPSGPRVRARSDGSVLLAMKGYSPVSLFHDRKWIKGDPRFAWEHQGLTYLLASADEFKKFQSDAERYAPRLLGCDPVLYFDDGRAVPGSTRYAAYFEDGLYLFTSAENRATFRDKPEQYTRRRTVLLIEELESTLR